MDSEPPIGSDAPGVMPPSDGAQADVPLLFQKMEEYRQLLTRTGGGFFRIKSGDGKVRVKMVVGKEPPEEELC